MRLSFLRGTIRMRHACSSIFAIAIFIVGAGPPQRHGGECFGKAVVSFAPTSASGCTNEAFAANDASH
jgi:hypothetical protein